MSSSQEARDAPPHANRRSWCWSPDPADAPDVPTPEEA
jgi:hypothetical protein